MEQSPVRDIQYDILCRYDYILNTLYFILFCILFYLIYKFIKLIFYFAILFGADSGAINYITETVCVLCVEHHSRNSLNSRTPLTRECYTKSLSLHSSDSYYLGLHHSLPLPYG